jgi:hypothetical protein
MKKTTSKLSKTQLCKNFNNENKNVYSNVNSCHWLNVKNWDVKMQIKLLTMKGQIGWLI